MLGYGQRRRRGRLVASHLPGMRTRGKVRAEALFAAGGGCPWARGYDRQDENRADQKQPCHAVEAVVDTAGLRLDPPQDERADEASGQPDGVDQSDTAGPGSWRKVLDRYR